MTATTAPHSSTNLQTSSISSRGFVRLAVAQPVVAALVLTGLVLTVLVLTGLVILLVVIPEGMR